MNKRARRQLTLAGHHCESHSDQITCDETRKINGGAIGQPLEELLRTNDIVLISFVEALLRDAGIKHIVVDQNMSVVEGSLGVLPRRVLVDEEQATAARRLLEDAGVGTEVVPPKKGP